MLSKDVTDAIARVYALNSEIGESSVVYAFPLEEDIVSSILEHFKDGLSYAALPKCDDDDASCPYMIVSGQNDGGGYSVFVFTAGFEVSKLLDAVRKVAVGEEPD